MNLRLIDWIWHVRGSVALAPGQSSREAFDRLDLLFRHTGTSHQKTNDRLVFQKKDQAAQDKMSIFDGGVLAIEKNAGGSILRYDLTSRILLFCFLLPLFFVGMAQLTIAIGKYQKASSEAAGKSGKGSAAKKPVAKKPEVPMNPLDKALGAPAPEKPKKDAKDKPNEGKKKPSPTSAYVFAAIFAILYTVGRVLEDWLVRSLFRKRLLGS